MKAVTIRVTLAVAALITGAVLGRSQVTYDRILKAADGTAELADLLRRLQKLAVQQTGTD